MKEPTAVQRAAWEAYQRHGGDGTPGALTAAAQELGKHAGSIYSALQGYRANTGLVVPGRARKERVSAGQVLAVLPDRIEALEQLVAALLGSQASLEATIGDLRGEIERWTQRQPIYVEMRPRHQREADGGSGGGPGGQGDAQAA